MVKGSRGNMGNLGIQWIEGELEEKGYGCDGGNKI